MLTHMKAYITFVYKAATPYPTAPASWQSDHPCACMLSMLRYTTKPPLTCCPWCAVLQEGNEITLNGVSFDSNRASNFGGAIRAQVRGVACSRVAALLYVPFSVCVVLRWQSVHLLLASHISHSSTQIQQERTATHLLLAAPYTPKPFSHPLLYPLPSSQGSFLCTSCSLTGPTDPPVWPKLSSYFLIPLLAGQLLVHLLLLHRQQGRAGRRSGPGQQDLGGL